MWHPLRAQSERELNLRRGQELAWCKTHLYFKLTTHLELDTFRNNTKRNRNDVFSQLANFLHASLGGHPIAQSIKMFLLHATPALHMKHLNTTLAPHFTDVHHHIVNENQTVRLETIMVKYSL